MTPKTLIGLIATLLLVILVGSVVYVVPETHRAVLLRFGELVESDVQPGIHIRLPFVNQVKQFDTRVLSIDLPAHQYLTIEKKPLDVDSYITWRITNVGQFYRSTSGDELRAVSLVSSRVDNGLRDQFGVRTMHEVISGQRDDLMTEITQQVNQLTETEFGIKVIDIRIKAIELPKEVSQNVYLRMSTEREKEAQELRSRGRELAEGIRADADRQRTVLLAEAYAESEKLRGEGDGVAAQTYADAYGQDAGFYRFYRSLSAYEQSFSRQGDMLVMDAKSEFMRFWKESSGK